MLADFVLTHRAEILARTRTKVEARSLPRPTPEELQNGVPLFLDQLAAALRRSVLSTAAISASATLHGGDLLRMGFTVGQVVHDYGDICQSITELAQELNAPISNDEFHTLNRCLDDAIAEAVTEFSRLRDTGQETDETERLGMLAHEIRNKVGAAMFAYAALKGGRVGVEGSTGAVLERNLRGLRTLVDGSLATVRIESGRQQRERISVPELVEEVTVDASMEAEAHGVGLNVEPVEAGLEVEADRAVLAAALGNLLQNAFKFTPTDGQVSLATTTADGNVHFAVEDECGGLPDGEPERLFASFTQRGENRQGLGLGLAITRKGIEASGGEVMVRDLPGKGCIFTITLPAPTSS